MTALCPGLQHAMAFLLLQNSSWQLCPVTRVPELGSKNLNKFMKERLLWVAKFKDNHFWFRKSPSANNWWLEDDYGDCDYVLALFLHLSVGT